MEAPNPDLARRQPLSRPHFIRISDLLKAAEFEFSHAWSVLLRVNPDDLLQHKEQRYHAAQPRAS